ncbi:MAG: hypothetical protein U0X91_27430 [Spirosomataceae bacterium]
MFRKAQLLFEEITAKVENNTSHFGWFLQLFFALLILRLTLEFFSSQKLFTPFDIIHIGLWFVFIVSAFLLQLHFFSGENILKVAKLVFTFFSISLSAPIIDLFFFKGQAAKMNYLSINNWPQFAWSYMSIGGANLQRGATLGIRIEIILLVVACFNYVRTKRNSIGYGLIAAWCIYTVLFLSGAVPFLLGILVNGLDLHYQPNDQSNISLFVLIDFLLLLTALYRYDPAFMQRYFFSFSSAYVVSFVLIYVAIGAYLACHLYPTNWFLNPTTLFYFPLLICIGLCFLFLWNLQQGGVAVPGGFTIKTAIAVLLFILSIVISYKAFFTVFITWSILFLLNEPPLFFSGIPILKNLFYGFLFIGFSWIGFCCFGGVLIGFPSVYIFILFVIASLVSYVHDYRKIMT